MKFLRQDGWFQPVAGADIVTSTATTTGFLNYVTKATTVDITIATTAYVDGPTVTQGTTGIWFVCGTVTLLSPGNLQLYARLHDGTTTVAASNQPNIAVNQFVSIGLSGIIVNPQGNLRISAASNGPNLVIKFNNTGFSQDSCITAIRIG